MCIGRRSEARRQRGRIVLWTLSLSVFSILLIGGAGARAEPGLVLPLPFESTPASPIEVHTLRPIGAEIWIASSRGLHRLDGDRFVPVWIKDPVLAVFPFGVAKRTHFLSKRYGLHSVDATGASVVAVPRANGRPLFERPQAAVAWQGGLWVRADSRLFHLWELDSGGLAGREVVLARQSDGHWVVAGTDSTGEHAVGTPARVAALMTAVNEEAANLVVLTQGGAVVLAPRAGQAEVQGVCSLSTAADDYDLAAVAEVGGLTYLLSQRSGPGEHAQAGPLWVFRSGACSLSGLGAGEVEAQVFEVAEQAGQPVVIADRGLFRGDAPASLLSRRFHTGVQEIAAGGLLLGDETGLWRLREGSLTRLAPLRSDRSVSRIWSIGKRILMQVASHVSNSELGEFVEEGAIEIEVGDLRLLGLHWLVGPHYRNVRASYRCPPGSTCAGRDGADLRIYAGDRDQLLAEIAAGGPGHSGGRVPIGEGYGPRTVSLIATDIHGNGAEREGLRVLVLAGKTVNLWLWRGLLVILAIVLLRRPTLRILTARFLLAVFLSEKAAYWLPVLSRRTRRFYLRDYARTSLLQDESTQVEQTAMQAQFPRLRELLADGGARASQRAGLLVATRADASARARAVEQCFHREFARRWRSGRLCPILLRLPPAPDAKPDELAEMLERQALLAIRSRGDIHEEAAQKSLVHGRDNCFLLALTSEPSSEVLEGLRELEQGVNARSHLVYVGTAEDLSALDLPEHRRVS